MPTESHFAGSLEAFSPSIETRPRSRSMTIIAGSICGSMRPQNASVSQGDRDETALVRYP